ncbi:MAG: hypothetical protein K8R87_06620 [Verrucomicrobia bacterium]|nr:hypothetical protein [Verrucomicrobiota bacterium]
MIPVSLSTLVMLGMALGVVLLGVLWLIAVWRERHGEKRTRADLVSCRICGSIYENTDKKISACPSCGSLNETSRPRPI